MKKKIWIIVIAVVLLFVVVFALRGSKVEEPEINLSESKINLTFAEDDDSYLKYKNSNKPQRNIKFISIFFCEQELSQFS